MFDTYVPLLTILGKYDIKGRILILPITGKGDLNITLSKYKNMFTFIMIIIIIMWNV